ncbi:MAG: hypothetical protein N2D54_07975 [Chloroflexota bacterium]
MNSRNTISASIIFIFLVVVIGGYLILSPRAVDFSPVGDGQIFPANTMISISFSREMNTESVLENMTITPQIDGEFSWNDNSLAFKPTEEWPRGAEISVQLAQGASSALGLVTRESYTWLFLVSRVQLAYLWPSNGPADLYMLEPLSGETQRITQNAEVLSFVTNQNGSTIYYTQRNEEGGSDLIALNRWGNTETKLFACQTNNCADLQLSFNEKLLAFTSTSVESGLEIWVLNVDTQDTRQISDPGEETRWPLWLPDGRLSFYSVPNQKYQVFDLESDSIEKIPNTAGEQGTWSPRGSRFVAPDFSAVVTTILRGPSGELDNEEVNQDDLEPVQVTTSHLISYDIENNSFSDFTRSTEIEDLSPEFSPNGLWIVFARKYLDAIRWTQGRQMWLMRSDGTQARSLTNAPDYKYTAFAWHPNGFQVATVRANVTAVTSPPEIWLVDIRNGDVLRLLIGAYNPQWVP